MIAVDIIKFVHLSCVMLFMGLFLSNYLLVARSMVADKTLFSFKLSVRLDILCGLLLLLLPLTGLLLVHPKGYYLSTPWIRAAELFAASLFLLLLASFKLKKTFYKVASQPIAASRARFLYHMVNILMLVVVVFVIHDAVIKTTLLFGV